jgi:hypothetical protein
MDAARKRPEERGFFLDSAALNLHDVYAGFERLFRQIAATVDGVVPSGQGWHRDLLQQMGLDLPETRLPVLSDVAIQELGEPLRFRHVVRSVYAFSLDFDRIHRLVQRAGSTYQQPKPSCSISPIFWNKLAAIEI